MASIFIREFAIHHLHHQSLDDLVSSAMEIVFVVQAVAFFFLVDASDKRNLPMSCDAPHMKIQKEH